MGKKFFVFSAALALAVGSAAAGLSFEKQVVEVNAAPDAEALTIDFPFEVTGEEEVTITSFDAPCSCLSAEISDGGRLVWQPGESGVVRGLFELGTFKGTVEKHIVLILKGQEEPSKLTLKVTIPELVKIEPPTLNWPIGGDADPKSFKITMHGEEPIKLLEASVSNPKFSYKLETVAEGKEYKLTVTPKTVEGRALGMVRMKTDSSISRHQRYQAFVMVKSNPKK